MRVADSRIYVLLQFAILSSFLVVLFAVSVISIATQLRVVGETLAPIANGVTWVNYYPAWFFQILTLLIVITLIGWTVSMERVFRKRYLNFGQLASWKASLLSISLLNILFLGTSHVISYPPFPLYQTYNAIILDFSILFGLDGQQFYDFASAILITVIVISTFLRHKGQGLRRCSLRLFQITSLVLLPLGVEIFAFDNAEWNLHVAQFQEAYNIIPWFTNAHLFYSCLALLAFTSLLGWLTAKPRVAPITIGHPKDVQD